MSRDGGDRERRTEWWQGVPVSGMGLTCSECSERCHQRCVSKRAIGIDAEDILVGKGAGEGR